MRNNDAIRVIWSNVNQAWFIMFYDQVLRVINSRDEAFAELKRIKGE